MTRLRIYGEHKAWKVKTGHILATTPDVKVRAEFCGVAEHVPVDSGFMMMIMHSEVEHKEHYAWVWGYGHLRHHVLKAGESLVLDDGHLVAMQHPMKYSLAGAGGMLGMFIGGDGLLLHFKGPGELISSSKNIRHYAKYLCPAALGA